MEGEGGSAVELGGIFVDDVLCMKEKVRGFRGLHVISQEVTILSWQERFFFSA
jgi:hypothetical protein